MNSNPDNKPARMHPVAKMAGILQIASMILAACSPFAPRQVNPDGSSSQPGQGEVSGTDLLTQSYLDQVLAGYESFVHKESGKEYLRLGNPTLVTSGGKIDFGNT